MRSHFIRAGSQLLISPQGKRKTCTYMQDRTPPRNVILRDGRKRILDQREGQAKDAAKHSQMRVHPRNRSLLDGFGKRLQPPLGLPFVRVLAPQSLVAIAAMMPITMLVPCGITSSLMVEPSVV